MILQFQSFSSAVDPTFWHALSRNKIEVYRLDDAPKDVRGCYSSIQPITISRRGEAGSEASARPVSVARLSVSARSFDAQGQDDITPAATCTAPGTLQNTNTIEEFKNLDKNEAFQNAARQIWEDIVSGRAVEDPALLTRFVLLTFADLKKYKYTYWFGFPALLPTEPYLLDAAPRPLDEVFSKQKIEALREQHRAKPLNFFLVGDSGDSGDDIKLYELKEWERVNAGQANPVVGFVDPSGLTDNPGWPLRNFLLLLTQRWKVKKVTVICYREGLRSSLELNSIVCDITIPPSSLDADPNVTPKSVGWEKNPAGKLGPRIADLAPLMDPAKLADTAVDLNLKLMRWRILPTLQLEKISVTKCLLLGSGTLGCHVARCLMAWGVRTITFVDNGKVSFSNPVRQPLFEFADCLDGGKTKAVAAADNLKKVFPGVNASAHSFNIPMPGHYHPASSPSAGADGGGQDPGRAALVKDIEILRDLIASHDAIFLLTDSRESRWLPTLLASSMNKIVINAALGFDTFMVMRHGVRVSAKSPTPSPTTTLINTPLSDTTPPPHLGCYFCTDVVGPTDSLHDRTLDQQCTVTRPGISSLASSTAVELLVSLLNHPLGAACPAPPPPTSSSAHPINDTSTDDLTRTPLGTTPHQLRGFLSHFAILPFVSQAFDNCPACSARVLGAYAKEGVEFVVKAVQDPAYLERVAGLEELRNAAEADVEGVDWDVEGEDDDGEELL
ncbi:uncharacterized protein EV422DRAFT_546234 [Fimicolochytrium jonesii]|uniref:uncharacterized protein n=1 Tax=Fimicolochytrium jonesii TaxID=1396493 RepID=UPI0022FEE123|nr:uncharacterized protein EV422DRAFT_546234 [Fimicolochytrium jonesii]KAI8816302.1 hypothetical protein EV422DRAFT_546234 [Fimicolochytrium jonesii]